MFALSISIVSIININLDLSNEMSSKIKGLEEVIFHCIGDSSANTLSYIILGYQYLFDLKMVWFSRKQGFCLCPHVICTPNADLIVLDGRRLQYTQGLHIKT